MAILAPDAPQINPADDPVGAAIRDILDAMAEDDGRDAGDTEPWWADLDAHADGHADEWADATA